MNSSAQRKGGGHVLEHINSAQNYNSSKVSSQYQMMGDRCAAIENENEQVVGENGSGYRNTMYAVVPQYTQNGLLPAAERQPFSVTDEGAAAGSSTQQPPCVQKRRRLKTPATYGGGTAQSVAHS